MISLKRPDDRGCPGRSGVDCRFNDLFPGQPPDPAAQLVIAECPEDALRYTQVLPELAEAAARRMEEVLAEAQNAEGGCQDGCQTEAQTGQ